MTPASIAGAVVTSVSPVEGTGPAVPFDAGGIELAADPAGVS